MNRIQNVSNQPGFKIGTKLSELKSKFDSQNLDAKIKNYFNNFCQSDSDQVITNENELAMLNSWFAGSEKIKMPEPDQNKKYTKYSEPDKGAEGLYEYDRKTKKMTTFETVTNKETGAVSHYVITDNRGADDILVDMDGDGYADARYIEGGTSQNPKRILTDENLNGLSDVQESTGNTDLPEVALNRFKKWGMSELIPYIKKSSGSKPEFFSAQINGEGMLMQKTENGIRIYRFDAAGKPNSKGMTFENADKLLEYINSKDCDFGKENYPETINMQDYMF